jgi:hypothetical protein
MERREEKEREGEEGEKRDNIYEDRYLSWCTKRE